MIPKPFKAVYTLYLLVGILSILILAVGFEQRYLQNNEVQMAQAYNRVQQVIIDKEIAALKLLQSLNDTTHYQRNWVDLIDQAQLLHLSMLIYQNDSLILWTDNDWNEDAKSIKNGTSCIETVNGYYLTIKQRKGSFTNLLLFRIHHKYAFNNQFIRNDFAKELGFIKDGIVITKPIESFVPIKNISGEFVFAMQLFSFTDKTPFWLRLAIACLIALLIGCIHLVARNYIQSSLWITTIGFWITVVSLRLIMIYYHLPAFLYEYKLFDPLIYASSNWFASLGDLWVNTSCVLWYLVLLESRTSGAQHHKEIGKMQFTLRFLGHGIVALVAAHLAIFFIQSLTIDSQISFDINNVFSINVFTYVGLIICITLLLIVYFVVRNWVRMIKRQSLSTRKVWTGFALFVVAYIVIASQLFEYALWVLSISTMLVFFVFKSLRIQLNRFQQYFVVIFIISLISATAIHYWATAKEIENRKLFASKLVSQNDITTDYFLKNVEKKIELDPYVKDYFTNPIIVKSQFEKRIRQLYFTGYLSKFEVSVLDYDSSGYFFKEKSSYAFSFVNQLYKNKSVETINEKFRLLSNESDIKGYLAKFTVYDFQQPIGYLFILLRPKLIQDENRFDELMIDGYRRNRRLVTDYSYAVYKDKNLVFQSGNYPYRIANTWGETHHAFNQFTENEYDHLLYTDEQPLTIVISKPSDSVLQVVGLFSFIFTFCTIALILILFVYIGINAQFLRDWKVLQLLWIPKLRVVFNRLLLIDKPEVLYIRTRIQTAIIFIVFITLLFTSYFTISFINQKYNNRQTERLMKKLRNVVITVENENIKEYNFADANELNAFINQIADFYDTDITLYSPKGKVVASSISKIYDEGIIASLMNPIAYFHLTLLKESQYSQYEDIATLNFQAAYAPVFKGNREVLGYIQLPYFSKQADLLTEISSVVVGFINLYVLLFLIIGVIAYLVSRNISYPLTLIQQKLSRTILGGQNEPIIWQRDDEIGELVKQYNNMIVQLEESAQKLAETERAGAWREIARQMAHEIKNPLTPMKLSIQHLQRAYKNNDPQIETKLNKTTELLINQIDILGELANEFSSFAKMPAPVYEWINIESALQELVDLYSINTTVKLLLKSNVQNDLHFDRSYFSRSLGNILKNAIQSIPENQHGLVEIWATEHTENFEFVVKDNGTGMTNEQAAQIFKPYFSTKISGMGLGLPIVKNMIESGGGTIEFTTTLSAGTIFTICLPKHTEHA